MLVELAIGDAYGAGFEYVDPRVVRAYNDLTRYVSHPRHRRKPGTYTDDTQMSLAIAELIVSGRPWTRESLADKFVEVFHRDPRTGYANRFYKFLKSVKDGTQFLAEIRPHSDKSGGAMRAAPIGVYLNVEEVIDKSSLQASITHNTRDGRNAAVAAALMAHYCLYERGPLSCVGEYIKEHVPGQWHEPWRGSVGSAGWMSVRAAITALSRAKSMSALLKRCVSFTGDVDTVATIALAAGACCQEIEQDLPEHLYKKLEKGKYGRDYLESLDACLMKLAKRRRHPST